jgi:hypothetical protein
MKSRIIRDIDMSERLIARELMGELVVAVEAGDEPAIVALVARLRAGEGGAFETALAELALSSPELVERLAETVEGLPRT